MRFDPDKFWSTHFDQLEATAESTWSASIINFLAQQGLEGMLVVSSADSFRSANDQLDSESGDGIMKEIWKSLSTDESVSFSARLSGDGLVFVFNVTAAGLPKLAQKHLASFKVNESLRIYRSMGCALIPAQSTAQREQWNLLMEGAEMAHTHAKKRGGNMAIRCTNPLRLTHLTQGGPDDFYWKAANFEVVFAGEPSRHIYEPRDGSACR